MRLKRKITVTLATAMLLTAILLPASAAADETYHYENEALGFSLTIPTDLEDKLVIEYTEETDSVGFYFAPAYGTEWEGDLFHIVRFQPRSAYLMEQYYYEYYSIIVFGTDCVYAMRNPGGGTHFAMEDKEDYLALSEALSLDYLRSNLELTQPDSWPVVTDDPAVPVLETDEDGWLQGYPDNTLRPDQAVTRVEAAVIVNRMLGRTAAETDQPSPFPDVADSFWGLGELTAAAGLS